MHCFPILTSSPVQQRARHRALALALLVLTATPAWSADPVWFEQPPSVDALREAFQGAPETPARTHAHTRGIDWSPSHRADPGGESAAVKAPPPPSRPSRLARVRHPSDAHPGHGVAMPIHFETGSARLAPGALRYLDALGAFLAADPQVHLRIEGHTDAKGDPRLNQVLSWERALSIYRVLVERYDVDPARLQPVGKGSSEPLADAAPEDDRNRRVQFQVERVASS